MKRARPAEDAGDRGRVTLNVGGTLFQTSLATLVPCSTYFARLFSTEWQKAMEEYFLDLDSDTFRILLSCMRRRETLLPEHDAELFKRTLLDAEFLGIDFLIDEVKVTVQKHMRTEQQTAAAFDLEHQDLRSAFRAGVLPERFWHPSAPSAATRPAKVIKQLVAAGDYDRAPSCWLLDPRPSTAHASARQ